MKKYNVIDCHTHLQTQPLIEEYFKKRKGYAIAIKALDSLIGNGNIFYDATKNCKNIFTCECIDALLPIKPQLDLIKSHLTAPYQVVGIKIYLGYQPIFADDEKLYPVYQFAQDNGLSVVFHCGVVSNQEKSSTYQKYTNCLSVDKVAVDFPQVNFIISHFDVPNFYQCATIVQKNDNVFTDISGIFERIDDMNLKAMMKQLEKDVSACYHYFSGLNRKVMFGTDFFGAEAGFDIVEEYQVVLKKVFGKKNLNNVLFENCTNAYPKIKTFLSTTTKENETETETLENS